MLLRRQEGAALGIYGPPEVPLRLSVIPERLIHRKAVESGGKIPSFPHFEVSAPRGKAPGLWSRKCLDLSWSPVFFFMPFWVQPRTR